MRWTFSVYVHVFIDKEKTGHETINIENTFDETKMFMMKTLVESVQAEVEKRDRIFDYIVVVKIKPYFEKISSQRAELPVEK
ncbi:MAG: hypothetical protein NTX82_00610 [Candidatus Parcubacteria bacterium]|nr:hypothetical protein [Candidatus Parcubacteria bacterium]